MLGLIRRAVSWRWYAPLVLAIWVLAPECRRLYDWQTSYHSFSPFAILPMLSLVPGIFVLPSAWNRIGAAYRHVSRLWVIAFGYAFMIALASGSTLSALFAGAVFFVPCLFGIILAAAPDDDIAVFYERMSNAIVWLAVITSVYGIYQYIAPPPWDVYWAQQANIEGSQGVTSSFSFRIFGTLNSTGPLAGFLALAILTTVPRLRLSRPWLLLAVVPCVIALILTSVRAEWLALALGIVIYVVLAPQRRAALVSLGAVTALFVAVAAGLLAVVSSTGADATVLNIEQRISTFGAIGNDSSAISRQGQTEDAMKEALSEPLGQGLGSSGGSTKLSGGTGAEIDNGVVEHFLEMGVLGFVLYELALIVGLVSGFVAWRRFSRARNLVAANYAAVAIAIQLVLFVTELDADQHENLPVIFFWLSVMLTSAFAPSGERVASIKRAVLAALTPSRA